MHSGAGGRGKVIRPAEGRIGIGPSGHAQVTHARHRVSRPERTCVNLSLDGGMRMAATPVIGPQVPGSYRRAWLALAVLASVATQTAEAQEVDSAYAPGIRVRVKVANASPLIGAVASDAEGGLTIVTMSGDTVVVARAAAAQIDVSRGRRSNSWKGARAGAIVGALLGLAAGFGLNSECNCDMEFGPEIIPVAAVSAGLLGGGIGLFIGSFSSSEQWTRARSHSPVTMDPVAGPTRLQVGIGARF